MPVKKPAIMRMVIDEQRGRNTTGPAGIDLWAKIVRVGLVEPYQANRITAFLCKIADQLRIIVRQVKADQDQLYVLVPRSGRL